MYFSSLRLNSADRGNQNLDRRYAEAMRLGLGEGQDIPRAGGRTVISAASATTGFIFVETMLGFGIYGIIAADTVLASHVTLLKPRTRGSHTR